MSRVPRAPLNSLPSRLARDYLVALHSMSRVPGAPSFLLSRMATKYDAIIIGTGQAGPALAVGWQAGMKVAIIERKRFGGTCVNNGCIPTKTLIASARTAHVARRAGDYGVTIPGSIAVDMKKVKARKDAVVRRSNEGLEKWLRDTKH